MTKFSKADRKAMEQFRKDGIAETKRAQEALDKIADLVLTYKPTAKTKKAKKRQRKRRKHARKS